MPTYTYQCRECSHKFDHRQSITDRKLRECPVCHNRTLERLIGSGSGIIFKGSGFYETDYAHPRPNKESHNERKDDTKKET